MMNSKSISVSMLVSACIVIAVPARAAVTYTYHGPQFTSIQNPNPGTDHYTTAQSITFSFTANSYLAANLSVASYGDSNFMPLSWAMSDGVHVNSSAAGGRLQSAGPTPGSFALFTSATGEITAWDAFSIQAYAADPLYTVNMRTFQYPASFNINNATTSDVSAIFPKDSSYSLHPINIGDYSGISGQWTVSGTPIPPVPEPDAVWLTLSGLGMLSAIALRRRAVTRSDLIR